MADVAGARRGVHDVLRLLGGHPLTDAVADAEAERQATTARDTTIPQVMRLIRETAVGHQHQVCLRSCPFWGGGGGCARAGPPHPLGRLGGGGGTLWGAGGEGGNECVPVLGAVPSAVAQNPGTHSWDERWAPGQCSGGQCPGLWRGPVDPPPPRLGGGGGGDEGL